MKPDLIIKQEKGMISHIQTSELINFLYMLKESDTQTDYYKFVKTRFMDEFVFPEQISKENAEEEFDLFSGRRN